jgi:glycosyltransferase involved in cell wall biosynthesis
MSAEPKMARPLVSTIIPAYNCERYVAEAVESVLSQSYQPQEVIVVDDGSTDGTRRVLESFGSAITLIHQKNAGEPAARNTGMRRARGEFIACLDGDDLWIPGKLELQMNYFDEHPEVGLVYSDLTLFNESGVVQESVNAWLNLSAPSGYIFPRLFAETLFGSGTVIFRKACLERTGPFDERFFVGSDYEMWLRMARFFQFGYVDRPLLKYRHHAAMATRGTGRILQDGMPWEARVITRTLELFPEIRQELGESTVRRRLARPYYYLGCSWLDRGNHAEARRMLARALHYRPMHLHCQLRYLATFLTPAQVSRAKNLYHRISRRGTSTKAKGNEESRAQAAG